MSNFSQDKQEGISSFPNNFKDLLFPHNQVKDQLVHRILHENLDDFYGLSEKVPFYRVYHATVEPKLSSIATEGLKAFYEQDRDKPRIFITPSPTLALWHVIENKPHDTLRRKGLLPEDMARGKPILLQLQIDKNWLKDQTDLKKPLDQVDFLRLLSEEKNIGTRKLETLNRLNTFRDVLKLEVEGFKKGQEATNLGIPLPVDHVPPEFIFVDYSPILVPVIGWKLRR